MVRLSPLPIFPTEELSHFHGRVTTSTVINRDAGFYFDGYVARCHSSGALVEHNSRAMQNYGYDVELELPC